jgi:hypothetical protein
MKKTLLENEGVSMSGQGRVLTTKIYY